MNRTRLVVVSERCALFASPVIALLIQPRSIALLLPIFALYFSSRLRLRRHLLPSSAVWLLPCILALYVLLSSLWATDPRAALVAGGLLALYIACSRLAFAAIANEETATVETIGHYFSIAFATTAVLLFATILTQGAIHRAIYAVFPILTPTNIKLVRWGSEGLEFIGLHFFNRHIALLNMLLWPTLLVVGRLAGTKRASAAGMVTASFALFLLVVATTFASDHQTSMLALSASTGIFLVYRVSPRSAQFLVAAGWIALVVLIRPASLVAYENNMHLATWMDINARARIVLWANTVEQMPNAPVLGVGAQSTRADSRLREHASHLPSQVHSPNTGPHAHNIYIQTWFELGVVGAGLLLGVGLCLLYRICQLARPIQDFAAATFVCVAATCASSFGMWQAWFMATCMTAIVMVALGVRLASSGAAEVNSDALVAADCSCSVHHSTR